MLWAQTTKLLNLEYTNSWREKRIILANHTFSKRDVRLAKDALFSKDESNRYLSYSNLSTAATRN